MSELLTVKDLSSGYRPEQTALADVNFSLKAGSTVGVIGPNGSGKTTLFRTLIGELKPLSGSIDLNGRIAYLPQIEHARLDFPATAFDVALMGAYPRTKWYLPVSKSDRRLTQRALDKVGIAAAGKKPFGELSGGQRQRVLIARALVQQADLLLLDEPFSGVDHPNSEAIMEVIDDLKSNGHTVMISTHDIQQAKCWESVLCLNGRQVAFGPTAPTLTSETIQQTYGHEILILDDGSRAVTVGHHHH